MTNTPQTPTIDRIAKIEEEVFDLEQDGYGTGIGTKKVRFLLSEFRRLESELTAIQTLLATTQDKLTQAAEALQRIASGEANPAQIAAETINKLEEKNDE